MLAVLLAAPMCREAVAAAVSLEAEGPFNPAFLIPLRPLKHLVPLPMAEAQSVQVAAGLV
jgi:hypothetical protein